MNVSQNVLDAIDILTDNAVQKAKYDKTIQAVILSCQDETIGQYRCRYQDSTIRAFSTNTDVLYTQGSMVYIQVPQGDFSKQKTILGSTSKLGINYISQAVGDQAYDKIGTNCIESSGQFYLDTNNEDYIYTIYAAGGQEVETDQSQSGEQPAESQIKINDQAIQLYLKESSSIILGASIQTAISPMRQFEGHYGMIFNLTFKDNASGKQVTRRYTIDETLMVDNPYRLSRKTRQYQVFDIDGPNFVRVQSIQIFNKDFSNATGKQTEKRLDNGDIILSDFEIIGAVRMSESEINGVAINFWTPEGRFFTEQDKDLDKSYRSIKAQVKIKGKLATAAQKISFYWGREHMGITSKSKQYNRFLGGGWQCLNQFNIIPAQEQGQEDIVEWVPGSDTYILYLKDALAENNRFRVAIVYDGTVVRKQINIQNLANDAYKVSIQSDGGTDFYFDNGSPTLTCLVGGQDKEEDENYTYSFSWGYVSKEGILQSLPQTTEELPQGSQIIKGNKIKNVQISNIVSFGSFKCSVYGINKETKNEIFLGTASVILTNKLQVEGTYSLVIENGAAAFQYDEDGVSPTNKSLDHPQVIQALSFTLYDNAGNILEVNPSNSQIRWIFPVKNTLLVKSNQVDAYEPYPDAPYVYIDNELELPYQIANRYNIRNQNNQIKLQINYQKNISLSAITQFTFVKQGEPGTNGTNYVVKILPNTTMNNPPSDIIITQIQKETGYRVNYGIGNSYSYTNIKDSGTRQFFKAQLWQSGQLVWEGTYLDPTSNKGNNLIQPEQVYWSTLNDKYDRHAFKIDDHLSGRMKYVGKGSWEGDSLATIIKCTITYESKNYYGTIPVMTKYINENYKDNYRFGLKENTGFKYVLYTSDGVSPQYDTSYPFEIQCYKQNENGQQENVSLNDEISYNFLPISKLVNEQKEETDLNLLKIIQREGTYQKNQFDVKPAMKYDGACVNVAVLCTIKNNGNQIGKLRIPIHFLLNKYGLAHLNEWDGNSIQIKDDGGYILSPQMGAGKKNNNNQFTGVLMGEVKQAGKIKSQTGLFGYASGDRTFFLDSQSGGALFGKNNAGRIVISPNLDKALIVGNNYWKDNNFNDKGFPDETKIIEKNGTIKESDNKAGMLIDLSTPQIKFGSGNFSVTKKGYLHAVGGGDIAGWQITNEELIGTWNLDGKITSTHLRKNGVIYSGEHNSLRVKTKKKQTPKEGFYLSGYGLSIGSKFIVDRNGVLKLGNGATLDPADKSKKHWTIDGNDSGQSYIAYGGTTAWSKANNDNDTTAQVYLGTDGISLGTRFSITNQGELTAYKGTIGGWEISKTQLKSSSNNIVLKANGSIEGGKAGKTKDGKDYDYTWSIDTNGQAKFNYITANNGGKIGGWTINGNKLSSHGLILNGNNGTITGGGMAWNGGDTIINISGLGNCSPGLTTGAGSMYSNSGYLGSGSPKNAPLSWDPSGVTLSQGVKIGNLEINKDGWISHSNGKVLITDSSVYANTLVATYGVKFGATANAPTLTTKLMNSAVTGKAEFSDGGWIYFTNGIATEVHKGSW